VGLVLGALVEGLDVSAAERVFGIRHATITRWLLRAGTHAQTLLERSFCKLTIPHLQLDELRTRLHSHTQVLWLWVAIDPLTKCIPVLRLGPRTHRMAFLLMHRLREQLQTPHLEAHLYWWQAYYHFVRPHASLRVVLLQGTRGRCLAGETTIPAADTSDGIWPNQSQVDHTEHPLLPAAAAPLYWLHRLSVQKNSV
jgi:hypothetical protein